MQNLEARPGWVIRNDGEHFIASLESIDPVSLPDHAVLIRVEHSSLNYKDVLSWGGHKGVTRQYPHTPGIDAAGVVVESASKEFSAGDDVIVVGYDLGMNTPGGHGGWIRVPAEWVIPKPEGLSPADCMTLGTAGFTAAQSLFRLQQQELHPEMGEVVVTGATGGVGSVAVSLLAQAGYAVAACTRQGEAGPWLKEIGASTIVSPDEVLNDASKPMVKARWAGAVDTVGGNLLESILRSTLHRGAVTCCGMIAGTDVNTSIFPFILRGVSLIGIDSAECPLPMKKEIWNRLANDWKPACLDRLQTAVSLQDLPKSVEQMRNGKTRGRIVVTH